MTMASTTESQEIRVPLLQEGDKIVNDVGEEPSNAEVLLEEDVQHYRQSTVMSSVFNLVNVILGTGTLALPRAFALLGLVGGSLSLVGVAFIAYFSVYVLIRASEHANQPTYNGLLQTLYGHRVAWSMRIVLVIALVGYMSIYLIVIADILIGNDVFQGVLPEFSQQLPDWLYDLITNRTFILTAITWLLVAPVCLPRTLGKLANISAGAFLCTVLFVIVTLVLCVVAGISGDLSNVHWLPDLRPPGTPLPAAIMQLLAVLPIIMTAFICQFAVHPLMQDLKHYSTKRMTGVVKSTLLSCTVLYMSFGIGGYALFGDLTQGDALSNFDMADLSPRFGKTAAKACVLLVKLSNALTLVLSVPLCNWPLRAEVISIFFSGGQQLSQTGYYALTVALLGAVYLLAVCMTSMWKVMGIMGSTLGIMLAFIYPGLVAVRYPGDIPGVFSAVRVGGYSLIGLGASLAFAGIFTSLSS